MRYWAIKDEAEIITSVESYSHDFDVANRVEITEAEFTAFINSLPPPLPPLDWKQEWLNAGANVSERLKVIAQRLGFV